MFGVWPQVLMAAPLAGMSGTLFGGAPDKENSLLEAPIWPASTVDTALRGTVLRRPNFTTLRVMGTSIAGSGTSYTGSWTLKAQRFRVPDLLGTLSLQDYRCLSLNHKARRRRQAPAFCFRYSRSFTAVPLLS